MCVCVRVQACARECACVFVTSDNYFKKLWSNILSAGNMTNNFAQKYLRNFVSLMKQKGDAWPFPLCRSSYQDWTASLSYCVSFCYDFTG